jgi:hypothetical protein
MIKLGNNVTTVKVDSQCEIFTVSKDVLDLEGCVDDCVEIDLQVLWHVSRPADHIDCIAFCASDEPNVGDAAWIRCHKAPRSLSLTAFSLSVSSHEQVFVDSFVVMLLTWNS